LKPRPAANTFWREGDDGLFSQTWYPICLASEALPGAILGRSFLDGQVIVFRGEDGRPHVFSAYCVHLGANLSEGDVVGNNIRCPYHHWEYDETGTCVKTGAGDPPPPSACLFEYPSQERWGVIFAFNGDAPLWELPDFHDVEGKRRYGDEDLCTVAEQLDYFPEDASRSSLPLDPWMVVTNPLDFQHFVSVHGMTFRDASPEKGIEWTEHCAQFRILATNRYGTPYDNHQAVYGNNCLYLSGNLDGRWFGFFAAQTIPAPGHSEIYFMAAADRGDGSPQALQDAQAWAQGVIKMETEFFMQDVPVLRSLNFKPGLLTKIDTALARHIDYLQSQPRAHPGANFIK
jgi:phenylpropionate dioxygenase-like ring-hydroxylating dioxygenase large terminal subunit